MAEFSPYEYAEPYRSMVLRGDASSGLSPTQVSMLHYQPTYHFASDEEGKWYWYDQADPQGNVANPDARHYFGPNDIAGWSPQQQQDYYFARGMTQEQSPGGAFYNPNQPGAIDALLGSIPEMLAGGILGAGAAGGLAAAGAGAGAGAGAAGGGLGAAFSLENPSLWWSALQALQRLSADPSGSNIGGILGSLAGSAGGAYFGVPGGGTVGGFAGRQLGGMADTTQTGSAGGATINPQQLQQLIMSLLLSDNASALQQNPQAMFALLQLLNTTR